METSKITELQEQRASHVARMREILDAADAEARDMTAEERQEYDRLESDVDTKAERIKMEQKLRAEELALGEHADRGFDPRAAQGGERGDNAELVEKYERAFDTYLRRGDLNLDADTRSILAAGSRELRDQAKGTNNLGGYLVPTDFQKKLAMHAVQAGTIRRTNATVIVTGAGEALQIPKTTVHGAASWVSEGSASTSNDETFGQITLSSYTVRRLVKVSVELVEDNAVDLESYIAREIGRSIGALENTGYVNGNGTGQPTGILANASLGTTGATGQTTSVTADDLFNLLYSVGPQYRGAASWLMADSTVKAVRKLKDNNGQYLWAPGAGGYNSVLANGEPDTLLGKPLFDDPDVPTMSANAKSIIFGDISAYYIRDVGQTGPEASERPMGAFAVIRLNERFMDGLQVGFLGYHRTDGNLVDQTGAVKYYANSAT